MPDQLRSQNYVTTCKKKQSLWGFRLLKRQSACSVHTHFHAHEFVSAEASVSYHFIHAHFCVHEIVLFAETTVPARFVHTQFYAQEIVLFAEMRDPARIVHVQFHAIETV